MHHRVRWIVVITIGTWAAPGSLQAEMKTGSVELQSVGPLAFAPGGILLVGDPKAATIVAIDTGDASGNADPVRLHVPGINEKVAAMLGSAVDQISINDLAVNPESGAAYLSVSRGRGADAMPVVLRVAADGTIHEVSTGNVKFSQVSLPNAPEDAVRGEGRRRRNRRLESITDLAYVEGKVIIAGLSNEEFASKLRTVDFPFAEADAGTSIEIYHGAHGKYETRSPIRTFAPYNIDDAPHLLAAYTCTPLVKLPVAALVPGEKIMGATIAELGNRNHPLDMIIYQKDGQDFVLLANSARGLMKISTDGIASIDEITERIGGGGTAGLPYETIEDVEGVVQLDRLNYDHALVLVEAESGVQDLRTIALP